MRNFLYHALLAAPASARWIVPGARWRDTQGELVNAHAGCVTVDEKTGRFYLFGEYKVEGQVEGGGISVYSSNDLVTWESHGMALGNLTNPASTNLDSCDLP
jgi:hypothetical protein